MLQLPSTVVSHILEDPFGTLKHVTNGLECSLVSSTGNLRAQIRPIFLRCAEN